jgi:hypothetical protein
MAEASPLPPICRTCGRIHALQSRPDRTIDWVTVPVDEYPAFLASRRELGRFLAALDAGESDEDEG